MPDLKLIIVGTGGFSQDITDHFLSLGVKNIGYVGRMTTKVSDRIKKNYLGTLEDFEFNPKQHQVFIALGENPGRKEAYELLCRERMKPITSIHPSATVMCSASLGQGVYIGPYCVVGSNAVIGENTFLNKFVNIGHDVQLGKSVTVYPYGCIGGSAKVGDNVLISTRSTVYPSTLIGCNCVIASNTEVRKNITDRTFIMSKTQQIKKSL